MWRSEMTQVKPDGKETSKRLSLNAKVIVPIDVASLEGQLSLLELDGRYENDLFGLGVPYLATRSPC